VRRRDTYASVSGVDFVDASNSIVYTYIDANAHKKYYANFGEPVSIPSFGSSPVQSGSYIGIDCSGKEITNFETQIKYDVAVLFDASTNYQFGWEGNSNDQSQTISSAPFSLTTSTVKDLAQGDINKEGYYLGVDVSNVKLDVSFNQLPDVGNNTPAYKKYRWNILQNSIDASGVIRKTSLYYEFYLGHAPTQSISISGLSVSTTAPTLTAVNYFGLKNPSLTTTSNPPQVKVQYTLNNLNPFWAPLSDPFTVFKFYIDPDNVVDDDIIGNTIINWPTTLTSTSYNFNETYNVSWNQTNAGDYNSVPYARALGTSPQFGSKDSSTNTNTFSNNIIITPTTIPYYSSSLNNNTTFGGKKLWWDFVWNNTNDLTINRIGYVGGGPTGKLFNR
jgi:hypothetical protein